MTRPPTPKRRRERSTQSSFDFFVDLLTLKSIGSEEKEKELKKFDYNFNFLQTMLMLLVFLLVALGMGLGGLLVGLELIS